jgi:UDP-N-acetylmuramyl tripeptide synthase
MRTFLAMALGKTARFLLRLVRRGGGSALPGRIAAAIQPKLLERAIQSAPHGLVVISGTAGKSSTTKIIVALLEAHGLKVFTNPSTANIKQGYYASILQFGNLRGQIAADIVVLEWDEGHGAALAKELKPRLSVITNVLSDQLDRFIDPIYVQERLGEIIKNSQTVVANRDDRNVAQIAVGHADVFGFGLAAELLPDGPSYAINFDEKPELSASALIKHATAERLLIMLKGTDLEIAGNYENLSQAMNVASAVLAVDALVEIDRDLVADTIEALPPVFARDEMALVRDRHVRLMLVQNPTSFQLNLDKLQTTPHPLMIMAGKDIHDPSWLWTVDFSKLDSVDVISGFNAHELALRLHYAGVEVRLVEPKIDLANEHFAKLSGSDPTIIFSADAMRRTRRYLGLAK